MKHMYKKICMLMMAFMLSISMIGCSSNAKDDASESNTNTNETGNNDIQARYQDAVSLARSDANSTKEVSREDLEKAIKYFKEYGSKDASELSDDEWHRLVYYSVWLQEIGKRDDSSVDHDFIGLATNVQGYADYSWLNGKDSDEQKRKDARSALDESLKGIENDTDGLINSFKDLIEGKTNTNE